MSADSDPGARKLTVAELLAQHGGGAATEQPTGRRRRGEDAAEETAPHAIIDRVRGTNPRMTPAGEPETNGAEPSGPAEPARPAEPVTRHLPTVTEDEPARQEGTATDLQPARDDGLDDLDSLDDLDEAYDADVEDDEPAEHSPLREWLGLVGVIVGGVVGGAAVWLLFNWLWGRRWIIALVVAVLVIAGAALGVRTLWRSRDAATMILTVVAALIVTVSPAILLVLRS
jgi:hypothetical protein